MFKLSKKADYGLIAVKHLAMHRNQHACSASEIAEEYGISSTLMAKVLQKLAHNALVAAKHGSTGGYQLAKDPDRISALDVITAIDGEKVDGAGDVARGINKKKEGDVTLTIVRKGNQRTITVTPNVIKPLIAPGATPQARSIVIPRIELGSIPEINISMPRIDLPTIPEINVQLPKMPKVRVIKAPQQPI